MDKSFETLVAIAEEAAVYLTARQAINLHNWLIEAGWPNVGEASAAPLVPIPDPPMIPPGSIGTAFLPPTLTVTMPLPQTPATEPPKPPRTRRTKAEMAAGRDIRDAETTPATAAPAAPASEPGGSHDNPPAGAVADQEALPWDLPGDDEPPVYPPMADEQVVDLQPLADGLLEVLAGIKTPEGLAAWIGMDAVEKDLATLQEDALNIYAAVFAAYVAKRGELNRSIEAARDLRAIADAMIVKLRKITTKAEYAKLQKDDEADIKFLIDAADKAIWAEVKAVAIEVYKGLAT